MSVVSFGSVNVDRVCRVDRETLDALAARHDRFPAAGETVAVDRLPEAFERYVTETLLGGKGANQAVAAAAAGADATLLGKVGDDADGFRERHPADASADVAVESDGPESGGVMGVLADRGVDVAGVEEAPGPTGTAYVFVAPGGENHIAILAGANGRVDPAYAHRHVDAVRAADVLLVQNELPTATTDALLLALDGQARRPAVVFDPAPAEGAADLLAHACVDYVTPNEQEADALAGALESFDGVVLRKHGPDPVVVEDRAEPDAAAAAFAVRPPAVEAVDTTGAGDVFAGAVAAELARGRSLAPAVEWAVAAASLSTTRVGVQRATPDRRAVERFLADRER